MIDTSQEKKETEGGQNTPPSLEASPASEPTIVAPHGATVNALLPEGNMPFYKNRSMLAALLIAVVLLLGAGYYIYSTQYAGGGTVAIVNGKSIHAKEFNESVALIEQSAEAQGIDLNDVSIREEIKKQALDILINNALLISAAKNSGFSVTDEEESATYDQLVAEVGGEDALKAQMEKVGLSEKKLRSNIQERILTDQYIESQTAITELTVSDEEVDAFVSTLGASPDELPPIEEIRPQIEAQILSQKQQQLVLDLIARLRAEATIEMRM